MYGIEKTTNDVRIDPFDVIKAILYLHFKKHSKLSMEDMRSFFNSKSNYFDMDDVHAFMNELIAIQRENSFIDINEIASMIRDDIECYPR